MKALTTLFFFLFWVFYLNAQLAIVETAVSLGGSSGDNGSSIETDYVGNVIVVGVFNGTIDLDAGPAIHQFLSVGAQDIFIRKTDSDGNFLWGKSIEGAGNEYVYDLTIDQQGNIYITGDHNSTIDFDPGIGTTILTASARTPFVLKLDTNGNFLWAKHFVGGAQAFGKAVAVDSMSNVYIAGEFTGTYDFDPSLGVFNLSSNTTYYSNAFIVKLDSNGNFGWAKAINGGAIIYLTELVVDYQQNIYVTGAFRFGDFDPGTGIYNMSTQGGYDGYVLKLDNGGNFVWAKQIGGSGSDYVDGISVDDFGNVYVTGSFEATIDLNPGLGTWYATALGHDNYYILKLTLNGGFIWAKTVLGTGNSYPKAIKIDRQQNLYITGWIGGTLNFGNGAYPLTSNGALDFFVHKLDNQGNSIWAKIMGGLGDDRSNALCVDDELNVYITGYHVGKINLEPNDTTAVLYPSGGGDDAFIVKIKQKKIFGKIFQDYSQNCQQESNEGGINNRMAQLSNGMVVITNSLGIWFLDSLPVGNYNINVDTSGEWQASCPSTQSFAIVSVDSFVQVPSFGLYSTNSCPSPDVSMHAPFLRPGFSNQNIYVQICNLGTATGLMDSTYVIVELDSLLTVLYASHNYYALGNNQYLVDLDTMYPGFCAYLVFSCSLSSNAILGQSLCLSSQLYGVDSCYLQVGHLPFNNNCLTAYDLSNLIIRPECRNDSIDFIIYNTGDGDMSCFSDMRLFIDGIFVWQDLIQLMSGDTAKFIFKSDGRTWRLEVDQHPLHPTSIVASATVELCGDSVNWTPNLVNIIAPDDFAPTLDIFCGEVRGSYDPNIKTAYPLGVSEDHLILPNQEIEYLIQFQNTGTDTAFTVVIRDTLSSDLDIFSVRSGASSHPYDFRVYGPGVLEWTFSNIMLPDSNINMVLSNGFVKFKARQQPNLALGTDINNRAAIYFDYNQPIITNDYSLRIGEFLLLGLQDHTVEEPLNFHTFPNPTNGKLTIEKVGIEQVQLMVIDNLGRIIIQQNLRHIRTDIDLSQLASGLYFLHFNDGMKTTIRKVIKY